MRECTAPIPSTSAVSTPPAARAPPATVVARRGQRIAPADPRQAGVAAGEALDVLAGAPGERQLVAPSMLSISSLVRRARAGACRRAERAAAAELSQGSTSTATAIAPSTGRPAAGRISQTAAEAPASTSSATSPGIDPQVEVLERVDVGHEPARRSPLRPARPPGTSPTRLR